MRPRSADPVPAAAGAAGLLTSAELARLLRVHPKHVYRLLRKGLPGLRVGGEWRFERDRVLAWAKQRAPRSSQLPEAPVLAANDDEAVAVLLAELAESEGPLFGCVRADSGRALDLVAAGRAMVAGYHRRDVPGWAGEKRLARIRFATREIGLVGRRGRPAPPLAACAERRLASRPPTSGARSLLDESLAASGFSPSEVHAHAAALPSHREVVCAVVRGEADVGITSRDWAEKVGLPFRPLGVERYELLVPVESLAHPAVVGLCGAAASRGVRRAVGALPGHSAGGAGELRIDAENAK